MPEKPSKPSPSGLVYQLPENQKIKIIGLGGIGSIVLQFLSLFLDSNLRQMTRLVLIDGDEFSPSNSPRTTFQQLGNKAEVKAGETLSMISSDRMAIVAIPRFITEENVGELICNGDLLMLCCDNHPTRKLISDHCERLSDVVLISGGNEGVDPPREMGTYGNVQIAVRRAGQNLTAPITRFHPEIAQAKGSPPLRNGLHPAGRLDSSDSHYQSGRRDRNAVRVLVFLSATPTALPIRKSNSMSWMHECCHS